MMEHSRPVRPRGRFCAWKPPRVDSLPVSTAAGTSSAGITAETPAIAAPFRKPLRLISGPILGLLSFITVHNWLCVRKLNLWPRVPRVICFLDDVLDLDLRSVERVFVGPPGFGVIEFKGNFVQLETPVRGILATAIAQRLHFSRGHRCKILCDFKILLENVQLFGSG